MTLPEHACWVVCPGDCESRCGRLCTVNGYLARSACSSCGEPIGEQVPCLFQLRAGTVHAACLAAALCSLLAGATARTVPGVRGAEVPSSSEGRGTRPCPTDPGGLDMEAFVGAAR